MADIIWLNLLTLIFFMPAIGLFTLTVSAGLPVPLIILITWAASLLVGPAYTGLHYVLLKMVRDEEGYITKGFFKSFRENFRQSIALAAVVAFVTAVLAADLWLLTVPQAGSFPVMLRIPILVVTVYLFMVSLWIFPLEARFVNKVSKTLKNAFFMSILAFPRTLGMAVMTLLPVLLFWFFGLRLVPFLIMFGISGPAFVSALLYNKIFKRFEPEEEATSSDEEFVLAEDAEKSDNTAEEIGEDNVKSEEGGNGEDD
ncbi:MAG: YesL family protein [Lachnospiraceae bacterium]|nr:YesL family protein [Lachnospiraceae bacterium]